MSTICISVKSGLKYSTVQVFLLAITYMVYIVKPLFYAASSKNGYTVCRVSNICKCHFITGYYGISVLFLLEFVSSLKRYLPKNETELVVPCTESFYYFKVSLR